MTLTLVIRRRAASIWSDTDSIKQITRDSGDKDLSGPVPRCMAVTLPPLS